jgi:hypothetical protein
VFILDGLFNIINSNGDSHLIEEPEKEKYYGDLLLSSACNKTKRMILHSLRQHLSLPQVAVLKIDTHIHRGGVSLAEIGLHTFWFQRHIHQGYEKWAQLQVGGWFLVDKWVQI